MLKKIISGGQTGVDRAALDVAIKLGIPCGGWAPKGRRAEDGPIPDRYALQEWSTTSYADRTEQNVISADGTLIISRGKLAGGTELTVTFAAKHNRPWLHVDLKTASGFKAAVEIIGWIQQHGIEILNVAGPRASENRDIYQKVLNLLETVFYMNLSDQGTAEARQVNFPKTIDDAVKSLVSGLPLKDKATIANLQEDELTGLYSTLGTYIRNNFGLWSGNEALLDDCRQVTGNQNVHQDDAAAIIIKELWTRVKGTHKLRVLK